MERISERISGLGKVLLTICIVAAVNWGLVGFFNFNLVDAIFGGGAREETSGVSRVIYALIGLAGVASLVPLFKTGERPVARRPAAAT